MRLKLGRQPAQVTEDAQFRERYGQAVRKLASSLKAAAAANAELAALASEAGVDLAVRSTLPWPWPELSLQPHRGAETRLVRWLRTAREIGFLT